MGLYAYVCVYVRTHAHTDCTVSAGDFLFYILLGLTLAL